MRLRSPAPEPRSRPDSAVNSPATAPNDAVSGVSAPAAPEVPIPFEGRTVVTVSELWPALEEIATQMQESSAVQKDYDAFVRTHALADQPSLFEDYVRVRLAFEATRDGGFWNLRWDITNRKPESDAVWSQWAGRVDVDPEAATAVAECDELSALFAVVARRLGVDRIGLMWPTWNHVVAVWTVTGVEGDDVRVVVPTSQIFLDADASLGTDGFDPWKQKTIHTYRSRDVSEDLELSAALARFFVQRARAHAARPQEQLQRMRNERAPRLAAP